MKQNDYTAACSLSDYVLITLSIGNLYNSKRNLKSHWILNNICLRHNSAFKEYYFGTYLFPLRSNLLKFWVLFSKLLLQWFLWINIMAIDLYFNDFFMECSHTKLQMSFLGYEHYLVSIQYNWVQPLALIMK